MKILVRGRLTGSSGKLASALFSHIPRREAPSARQFVRASPRLLHRASLPALASVPSQAQDHSGGGGAPPADAVETTAKQLQEEIFTVLCQGKPSSSSLLALVRGIIAAGAQPSIEVVQALANHFAERKDAKSLKAVLSLLQGSNSSVLVTRAGGSQSLEGIISVVFSRLVCAHCGRKDVKGALAEVLEMEAAGGEVDTEVFFQLLEACSMAIPPLLGQVDTVWAHIEERGLMMKGGVQQDLFTARMAAYANGAGYAPLGQSQEDWQQTLLNRVDEAWEEMLRMLASSPEGLGSTIEEEGVVTAESWLARASALALCVRDESTVSDAAMSRSLEALQSHRRCGGSFAGVDEVSALAEVVRGLARCGRQTEAADILQDLRQAAERAEDNASVVATKTSSTEFDKAKAMATATPPARVPDDLLRALGARGRGLASGGRSYGLALLEVVEGVAAEAYACGGRSQEDVDSRLTATLQAILTTSELLDSGDAGVVNDAARVALDSAAAAAAACFDSPEKGENHAVEKSSCVEGGAAAAAAGASTGWPGPNLAAMCVLTLLHVSRNQREGIPAAIDVLQQMYDRGLCPPPSLAAQLEAIIKRRGTVRQKRRASFLLARALDGFGPPVVGEDESVYDETSTTVGRGNESRPRGTRIGDAIRSMVESSITRREDEWDAKYSPLAEEAEELADSIGGGGGGGGGDAASADGTGVGDGADEAPPLSAEASYRLLQRRLREASLGGGASAGVRSVERACAAAAATPAAAAAAAPADGVENTEQMSAGESQGLLVSETTPGVQQAVDSNRDILRRVTVLAEKGRAHAALLALQTVDGRKRGMRSAVPYKVYGLMFRALSIGYPAQGRDELELAAAPSEALQWLLRGMARQGYSATTTTLNFGLEAFAVAARTRKVQEGDEELRTRVCTEAMDFMEGMRDGWDGLLPPVAPNTVSFNIIIKVMCRLRMFDQAFQALEVMERGGFEPDRFTYGTLIHGLAKIGDADGAWEVMVDMTNKGIAPNSLVIDGIIDAFLRTGDVGEGISFAQHAFNQYGCAPTAEKFCRVVHAATALDDGQHEARRAIVVAEQMWTEDWRGEGRSSHPVLGHPNMRSLLEERGAFDQVKRL